MLAAHHDQENRTFATNINSKQPLQAKTPGARHPKTPLKIPLNDENLNRGVACKSVRPLTRNNENLVTLGKGKAVMATPMEPRTARAPLGNKTTNAKARTEQQQATGVKGTVRQIERTQVKLTTTQRPKLGPAQVESAKLEIHTDKNPLDDEEDVEYAPSRVQDLPYESDILPENLLTFVGLKKENMFKGYYQYYYQDVDENGRSSKDRDMEERRLQALKKGEEQIMKDNEEMDWTVGDVPGTSDFFRRKKETDIGASQSSVDKKVARLASKPPSTVASRKAVSALSMPSQPTASMRAKTSRAQPIATKVSSIPLQAKRVVNKPAITRTSSAEHAPAIAASRSTIGYSKGRSASSAMHARSASVSANVSRGGQIPQGSQNETALNPRTFSRTARTASSGSDATITPARFAQGQAIQDNELKKLEFLSIFDVEEDDDGDIGGTPDFEDLDDDFQLTTDF